MLESSTLDKLVAESARGSCLESTVVGFSWGAGQGEKRRFEEPIGSFLAAQSSRGDAADDLCSCKDVGV